MAYPKGTLRNFLEEGNILNVKNEHGTANNEIEMGEREAALLNAELRRTALPDQYRLRYIGVLLVLIGVMAGMALAMLS